MHRCSRPPQRAAVLAIVAFHTGAMAVNGAPPPDAAAVANNPAGIARVPASTTFGLQVFRGQSSSLTSKVQMLPPGYHHTF